MFKPTRMSVRAILLVLPMLLVAACNDGGPEEGAAQAPVTFVFSTRAYDRIEGIPLVPTAFFATTVDPEVIASARAQLRLPPAERLLHVNGPITSASAGENGQHNWRFIDDEWVLAEASMEVCDGAPHMVDEDLESWLKLGRFCPWDSYVAREVGAPTASGIIVRFTGNPSGTTLQALIGQVGDVAADRGVELTYLQEGALGAHVWGFGFERPVDDVEKLAKAISTQVNGVDYAEPNLIMHPMGNQ